MRKIIFVSLLFFHSFLSFHANLQTVYLISFFVIIIPTSKYSPTNTKVLLSNIMNLRDEGFYEFIRQLSGKKMTELLAFQESNGIDSFLGCGDATAVL